MRSDGRSNDALRDIRFETHYIAHHPGSVLVHYGKTRVLVTATVENRVPPHRQESGGGWLTAEYGMLPGSTIDRKARPGNKGPDGRAMEIQRLIGRSLRQAIRLNAIGPRTIAIDCDVIEADGGTRTAAITGAWVALWLCVQHLINKGDIKDRRIEEIVHTQVAAVSLGILGDEIYTDLCYSEDVEANTDSNLVACTDGGIVEFQGTAEREPMKRAQLDQILDQGLRAIATLCQLQREVIARSPSTAAG